MSTNCNTFSTEVVPGGRIELPTRGFSGLCSTTELPRPILNGRQDTQLDNVILYVTNSPTIIPNREKAGAKREISSFCYEMKYTNRSIIQIYIQKSRENAYKVSSKKNTYMDVASCAVERAVYFKKN